MEIKGKRALVTGASAGIGRACALMLARQGAATVVVADIDEPGLEELASEIRSFGTEALIETVDLSDTAAAMAMYGRAERRSGGLDIIHNNAGIMGGPPDFPDDDIARMIKAVQINLLAMMIGTKMGVGFLRARAAPGVIINTSSTAAFGPLPKDPAYAASKRGILAYSESCQPLHEEFGIRVIPLCPAVTDTAIVAKDAPWLKPILQSIRMLEPDEIAAHVQRIIENDSLSGDAVTVNNEQFAS
ncbi:hypothetical protein ASE06_15680 [Sphingopyxis sp. Root214]|uniref:SDR family NAD(P)-dependent oxidoreductase n=1 Tax=unclassified Sphingopyxis TaxID=2614943 RepID=UPI0006F97239|nr:MULTISPECIES: SDR family NAD(P)-dependent oxidoreductase [unclassified Sphingopyxis]KQZ73776.1 hypothetical protein ASD73_13335 [Sphingopyxis sp. Root154]KRC07917.1 hypothetical protein ASE06_15680 [Sphingopyxis sp. Root214]